MAELFKQVTTHSLRCPVCLNIFREPKLLSCSHTFCKPCLSQLLPIHGGHAKLLCPVCRQMTTVPSGDVGLLQTNLALRSLVEDANSQEQTCTNCDRDPKCRALVYCRDCDTYFCDSCRHIHSQLKALYSHELHPVADVKAGLCLVGRQRKRKLSLSGDDGESFCCDCKKYVSLRSGVLDHERLGHVVEEARTHEEKQRRTIEELVSKATLKIDTIGGTVSSIEQLERRLTSRVDIVERSIREAHGLAIVELQEATDKLKERLSSKTGQLEQDLAKRKEMVRKELYKLSSLKELVSNGLRVQLEADSLNAHDAVCEELIGLVEGEKTDLTALSSDVEQIEKITFHRNGEECVLNVDVGHLEETEWPCTTVTLSNEDSMSTLVPIPDGTLGVGCGRGGVDIYDVEGQLIKTVLRDESIRDFGFLSDGRVVVLEYSNVMSLYTKEWEKLDVECVTFPKATHGMASLAVNRGSDYVYVSYRKSRHIQFFSPTNAREVEPFAFIECDDFISTQLLARNSRFCSSFVIQVKGGIVKSVNSEGKVTGELSEEGVYGFPCICKDGSIMVAWVNHDAGLVNIDKYTTDLLHCTQAIISDFKIDKPKRKWYHLKEFVAGDIAFCTPDKLHIFRKVSRPVGP